MNQAEYQCVIEELDTLIAETRKLMVRFEGTGMNDEMPDDYAKLELIITQALKEQSHYTQKMLNIVD